MIVGHCDVCECVDMSNRLHTQHDGKRRQCMLQIKLNSMTPATTELYTVCLKKLPPFCFLE